MSLGDVFRSIGGYIADLKLQNQEEMNEYRERYRDASLEYLYWKQERADGKRKIIFAMLINERERAAKMSDE